MVRFVIKLSGGQLNEKEANGILFIAGALLNIIALIIFMQTPPL